MREFTLVEENHVTDEIREAHSKYVRFHDLYDGLTWRLCRDPLPREAEEIAPETFLVKSARWGYDGFCEVCLVYTIDDQAEKINIVDMWVNDIEA